MTEHRGKFIVLYGGNNLGKSRQIELLDETIQGLGHITKKIKYPVYELEPTGPKINSVLRKGVEMDELKVQKLYAQNRRDFEPTLRSYLARGMWVISEDYTGTGIAWGTVRGVPLKTLEKINQDLLKEDLSILLYGQRFKTGIESNHRNETDDKIWENAQNRHLELADRYGWAKVYASRPPLEVHQDILDIVNKKLLTK